MDKEKLIDLINQLSTIGIKLISINPESAFEIGGAAKVDNRFKLLIEVVS
jgi:hypothetical protein